MISVPNFRSRKEYQQLKELKRPGSYQVQLLLKKAVLPVIMITTIIYEAQCCGIAL
jgi:hypothetical protein